VAAGVRRRIAYYPKTERMRTDMTLRLAINGLGRIERSILKRAGPFRP